MTLFLSIHFFHFCYDGYVEPHEMGFFCRFLWWILSKTLTQLSSVLVKQYRLFLFDQWFYYFKHVNSSSGYSLCRWWCQGCKRCVCVCVCKTQREIEGVRIFHFRVVYRIKSNQLLWTRKNASFYRINISKWKDEGHWDSIDCLYIEFFPLFYNLGALNNFA